MYWWIVWILSFPYGKIFNYKFKFLYIGFFRISIYSCATFGNLCHLRNLSISFDKFIVIKLIIIFLLHPFNACNIYSDFPFSFLILIISLFPLIIGIGKNFSILLIFANNLLNDLISSFTYYLFNYFQPLYLLFPSFTYLMFFFRSVNVEDN